MFKWLKNCLTSLMMVTLIVGMFYLIISSVVIRVKHPEFSETQVLIKMFIWDYDGE